MGDTVDSGKGLPYRPASLQAYVAQRAGMTTLCRSKLYPPIQGQMNLATGFEPDLRQNSRKK